MQERRNSSVLAMELRLSCTNTSNFWLQWHKCDDDSQEKLGI